MAVRFDKSLEFLVVVHSQIIKKNRDFIAAVMLLDLSHQFFNLIKLDRVFTQNAAYYLPSGVDRCNSANRSKTVLSFEKLIIIKRLAPCLFNH